MPEDQVGPQPDPVEPAGLDAIIDSAIEKSGYGEEPKADVETSATPGTEPDVKIDADGRARGPDGKFASTKPAEAEPSVTEPAKADAQAQPTTGVVEPLKAEPIQPHARWDDALKADFAKWPPEAQKAFLDRHSAIEADYTRKTQELSETRKAVEPLFQEVSKWSPYLQQIGVTPDQAFTQMLTTEYTLRTGSPDQKAQALAYLAQLYGVPIPTHAGEPGQPGDPVVTQLRQELSGVQQQLRGMNEQRVLHERQRAQAEFDALAQIKDDSGQVKFPHFGRVKQTMIQLVASNQAETWDQAYTKAVRLDDDLYKENVETERKSVQAAAEKSRLEAVEKAKNAKQVHTTQGSPKGGTQLKGLDAHINSAIERAGLGG